MQQPHNKPQQPGVVPTLKNPEAPRPPHPQPLPNPSSLPVAPPSSAPAPLLVPPSATAFSVSPACPRVSPLPQPEPKIVISVRVDRDPAAPFAVGAPSRPHPRQPVSSFLLRRSNLGQEIQKVLNQYYKAPHPHPNNVTVPNAAGQMVLWNNLNPHEQETIIAKHRKGANNRLIMAYPSNAKMEALIPRWTHGCVHAGRVSIHILWLAHLYENVLGIRFTEEEIVLAQYLAAFHDSARQADGVDVWDDMSAENARAFLTQLRYPKDKIETAITILKEKDSPVKRNSLSYLIHDADCADIIRVYGKRFKSNFLCLFQLDPTKIDVVNKAWNQLQKELESFIECTERAAFKLYIEKGSSNIYKDLLAILATTYRGAPCFPELTKLLRPYLEGLSMSKLSQYCFANERYHPDHSPAIMTLPGLHHSRIVVDLARGFIFEKAAHGAAPGYGEQIGSRIAFQITNGLVPIAWFEKNLIMQSYVEMDSSLFSNGPEIIFSRLTDRQREQLFVHLIADKAIANLDTHNGQFAIDPQGNVVSFDKGQAFRFFGVRDAKFVNYSVKERPAFVSAYDGFDPFIGYTLIPGSFSLYAEFGRYLTANPRKLQRILNSYVVQEALENCTNFALDDTTKSQLAFYAAAANQKPDFDVAIIRHIREIPNKVRAWSQPRLQIRDEPLVGPPAPAPAPTK